MSLRYIAVIADRARQGASLYKHLQLADMAVAYESACAQILVARDTPFLVAPGFGLLIGRLYNKDGSPIEQFPEIAGPPSDFFDHLLDNAWGQYIAFQFEGDEKSAPLAVLRDPSGAMPCAYYSDKGNGFITSDIELAVELGIYRRQVDWQSVHDGLSTPYLKTQNTMLAGIFELLPGNTLTWQRDKASQASRWSPWRFVEAGARHQDRRSAEADVFQAVSTVVSTLVADEDNFIVELSGGLDSSIVSACLGDAAHRALFCTLVIAVAGTDESAYAKLVTDAMDQPLQRIDVGFEGIDFTFPISPGSVRPSIGAMEHITNQAWETVAAKHGAASFFSGGGGDSVFCYLMTAAPAADAFLERGLRAGVEAIQDLAALHQCTAWKAAKLTLNKLRRKPATFSKKDSRFLNPTYAQRLVANHPWLDAPTAALPGDREKIMDLAGTQLFREITFRGADRVIHFPLLSQPVMEACLKIPTWMWIAGGRNRAVARDAFLGRLPPAILQRRSKGSHIGYMGAVYARSRQTMRALLMEGALSAHGLLDLPALDRYLMQESIPTDLSFLRIFQLCAAENWVRHQLQSP